MRGCVRVRVDGCVCAITNNVLSEMVKYVFQGGSTCLFVEISSYVIPLLAKGAATDFEGYQTLTLERKSIITITLINQDLKCMWMFFLNRTQFHLYSGNYDLMINDDKCNDLASSPTFGEPLNS